MGPMKFNRPKPKEVFTPRSHDLNQRTYAERPILEKRLRRALSGHKYIIIFGESGNGKTWLYKRVLQDEEIQYQVVNLAKMHTDGSLNAVLNAKSGELGVELVTGLKKEFDVGARPGGLGGGFKDVTEIQPVPLSALELLANQMHMTSSGKLSVLVLDNFEQIIDNLDFVRQVASLIISADDEFVSRNRIKIMLVGTPSNIRDMISRVSHANTIANRVVEIPEVARLEMGEARHIMSQGFETHLRLTILVDKNELYKTIAYKTDRIAQHIQELCLKIAQNALENGGVFNEKLVTDSAMEWIEETLSTDLAVIESHMNAQRSTVGRKNQVIYCLGLLEKEDFSHRDVEREIRRTFVVDDAINLNIPQILAGFAREESSIIRRVGRRRSNYRFCSPKLKMVIRTQLYLDSANNVTRMK